MKTVNEVLGKIKGEDKVTEVLTGKGAFSKAGFSDLTNALANDTTYKVTSVDKDGNKIETNLSELLRADLKKTLDNAKYPQKPEAGVLDTCDISTKGLAEAIPYIVREQMQCGKKFDIPSTEKMVGGVYLANKPGETKDIKVRDMKTGEVIGSTTVTNKDCIQIRAKSPVPKNLQTKVRKDLNGNVVK